MDEQSIFGDWRFQAAAMLAPVAAVAISVAGTIFGFGVGGGVLMGAVDLTSVVHGVADPTSCALNALNATDTFVNTISTAVANMANTPIISPAIETAGKAVGLIAGVGSAVGAGVTTFVVPRLPGAIKGIESVFGIAGIVCTDVERRIQNPIRKLLPAIRSHLKLFA